jgi:hypothetical protein
MSLLKRHKVDSKCRHFQEKWLDEYFCVSMNGKASCLIYSEIISIYKIVILQGIAIRSTKKNTITVSVLSE